MALHCLEDWHLRLPLYRWHYTVWKTGTSVYLCTDGTTLSGRLAPPSTLVQMALHWKTGTSVYPYTDGTTLSRRLAPLSILVQMTLHCLEVDTGVTSAVEVEDGHLH
ncbi:hypothetical protein OTU49_008651 [Cherax quadricarinatus]|uniref:Uncharacterized protein n=1 Tax=Cherax quadricarinatus TaxID=27406 RepID=A0AAW0WPA0_CHEQU